jgi:hypothetical protein
MSVRTIARWATLWLVEGLVLACADWVIFITSGSDRILLNRCRVETL